MEVKHQNTAVLIFSRSAAEEAALKRFAPAQGYRRNVAIAHQFIAHTDRVAAQSGLPVLCCNAAIQQGSSFEERFANAMEWAFAQGYENIISIGTDCPALTPEMLRLAAENLQAGKTILGPSKDGGVYMVGLHRADYNRADFMSLSWESSRLLQSWTEQANVQGQLLEIGLLAADVDDAIDFEVLLSSEESNQALALRLKALLHSSAIQALHRSESGTLLHLPQGDFLRGPPRKAA
jgi:glycosyltransferase A (GT-A) superfamily protein (DUF2064 family)